jgi:hypothetical protein
MTTKTTDDQERTDEEAPPGWRGETVHGGADYHHRETGTVVELRRQRHPASRTLRGGETAVDVHYRILVRPEPGAPATDSTTVRAGDKSDAKRRARETCREYAEGR